MTPHKKILEDKLNSKFRKEDFVSGMVRCVGFSDKLILEFSLKEAMNTIHNEQGHSAFKIVLKTINSLYLPFRSSIHKSNDKDWNDDLQASKKVKYLKMESVVKANLAVGDKIELKTAKGPEGKSNKGIIRAIKSKSIECDFGLTYTYAIPYSAIVSHLKKITALSMERTTDRTNKNNNLQNHML